MQISTFQALCLLPNDEKFQGFVKYRDRRSASVRIKRYHTALTLEQVVGMFEAVSVARLIRSRGFGYLVTDGNRYVKADGKKAKAFADACGVQFKKRKPRV